MSNTIAVKQTGYWQRVVLCLIGTAVTFLYFCRVFLPEVSGWTVMFCSVLPVCCFAVCYRNGRNFGWIIFAAYAAVIALLALLSADFLEAINQMPDALAAKISRISVSIKTFMPDYSIGYYVWKGKPIFTVTAYIMGLLLAFFMARTMLRRQRFGGTLLTVAVVTAATFVAKERDGSVYPLLIISFLLSLCCLTVRVKKGSNRRWLQKSIYSLTLAAAVLLSALSGTMYAFKAPIRKALYSLGADCGLYTLKYPNGSPAFGPGSGEYEDVGVAYIDAAEYAYVNDLGVYPSGKTIYRSTVPWYDGTIYLKSKSFRSFDGRRWSDENRQAVFSDASVLIRNKVKTATLEFTSQGASDVSYTYTKNETFDRERSPISKTASVVLPVSPTSQNFMGMFNDAVKYSKEAFTTEIKGTIDINMLPLENLAIDILNKYKYDSDNLTVNAVYAVREYLKTKTYTRVPREGDNYEKYDPNESAVYNFLFNTGEGYCVHYATAAVLLFKAMGIKARYCVGYAFYSTHGQQVEVTDYNAHAWPEIFVENLGWVPVEVTFSDTDSQVITDTSDTSDTSVAESEAAETSSLEPVSPEPVSSGVSEEASSATSEEDISGSLIIAAMIAVCCFALIGYIAFTCRITNIRGKKRRKLYYDSAAGKSDGGDTRVSVRQLYRCALNLLAILGITFAPGEQTDAFAARADSSDADIPKLADVAGIFMTAEFGGQTDEKQLAACGEYLIALNDYVYRKLPWYKRWYSYFTSRLISPRKR